MTPKLVQLRAAQILEQDAKDLKDSHTLSDGRWHITDPADEAAKADHDERLILAAQLRLMAGLS